jgi:hypothetical protein
MKLKNHLKIVLYLFLQLCFAEIISCFLYALVNGNIINGINVFFICITSAILITVISIAKAKIIKSLLKMEILLTLIFELCISFRLLSISTVIVAKNELMLLIPFSLPSVAVFLCTLSFIVYFILTLKKHEKLYSFKEIIIYLVLTITYKIIETGIWYVIAFTLPSSDLTTSTGFITEILIKTAITLVGIFIFLYIYLMSKINVNNKREKQENPTLEVVILFIGTIPLTHLMTYVMVIRYLLH